MKKVVLCIFIGCIAVFVCNYAYGFLPGKPVAHLQAGGLINLRVEEFVKLSAKQLSDLTGRKMSAGEKLSFAILKMQMKNALKKDPGLQVKDYPFLKKRSTVKKVLFWIILGALALIFLFILIFGLGPR